jgi:uncharacterized protein (TIGR02453 family)
MISKATFQFLSELKVNNNRDWFNDNKTVYEKARQEFIQFIDALIASIARFDSGIAHHSAKDCVFRIHQDVRFSKDNAL